MKQEHLYVVHFSDGTVKVGRSVRPQVRLSEHRSAAACFGISVAGFQSMACHGDALKAETHLVAECSARASSVRRAEWFLGIDYSQACALAREAAALGLRIDPVRETLQRAGGVTAVARRLGIAADTVRDWTAIPQRHEAAIAAMHPAGQAANDVAANLYSRLFARFASRMEAA